MSTREKVNLFVIGYAIGLIITSALDLADELHAVSNQAESQRHRANMSNEARGRIFDALRTERRRSAELAAEVRQLRSEETSR